MHTQALADGEGGASGLSAAALLPRPAKLCDPARHGSLVGATGGVRVLARLGHPPLLPRPHGHPVVPSPLRRHGRPGRRDRPAAGSWPGTLARGLRPARARAGRPLPAPAGAARSGDQAGRAAAGLVT